MITTPKALAQVATVPVREGRVCMITARGGKGLIVPKGHIETGRTARQMALQEAWEEAGLIGILHRRSLGTYRYEKAGLQFEVLMYLMDVTAIAKIWPECRERSRHWLLPDEAVAHVRVPGLRRLLRSIRDFRR